MITNVDILPELGQPDALRDSRIFMGRKVSPEQESFIVASGQTGQMQTREFEGEEIVAATNRTEQKIQLMNVLGNLAAAKSHDGAASDGAAGALTERYGSRAPAVASGAKRRANEFKVAATREFERASGMHVLIDSGVATTAEARRITRELFSDFLKKYHLTPSNKESAAYRKQLETEVNQLQTQQSVFNREHNLRPHKKDTKTQEKSDKEPAPISKDTLGTRARMLAIDGDVRAGFLPRSNDEKNKVMAYLDYLDNPNYPLGVNNQLFEVMNHQQRYRRAKPGMPKPIRGGGQDAVRAVESIVWELGDYFADANITLQVLRSLEDAMYNASPRLMLHELDDVGIGHPGIVRLVRDLDIRLFVTIGKIEVPTGDPLAGTLVRTVASTNRLPGRHKTLYDQYTRPDLGKTRKTERLQGYLQSRISSLTVGEARKALCIKG